MHGAAAGAPLLSYLLILWAGRVFGAAGPRRGAPDPPTEPNGLPRAVQCRA
jgi:hypothetical protein